MRESVHLGVMVREWVLKCGCEIETAYHPERDEVEELWVSRHHSCRKKHRWAIPLLNRIEQIARSSSNL